jgi:hypothetical protein
MPAPGSTPAPATPDPAPVRPSPLLPAAGLPLLYFAFAHACLALAFGILLVQPGLPGTFFHHPRMVAVVHLVTLGWISSSILGAFYIVAPLALRMPLRPARGDRVAFASFAAGVSGMVAHFWIGEYRGMLWSVPLVLGAVLHVAVRALAGLRGAAVPWPVKLHVALAFVNMIAASLLGLVVGINRVSGWLPWPPMASAFAHAHLAAIGWAMMMVVGLSYRLLPMIVPAAMPTGAAMARSAVLIETGLVVLVVALIGQSRWTTAGAILIVLGLASFVREIRGIVTRRMPPPAALPRPDWATWQTQAAFAWLLLASVLGVILSTGVSPGWLVPLGWIYAIAGLVGFLAQVVVGIQGRLLPLHGWYRGFEAGGMRPPPVSAHALASPVLARLIFLAWLAGVPVLTAGLVTERRPAIALGSAMLLVAVVMNAAQAVRVATAAAAGDGVAAPRARDSHTGAR